VSVIELTVLSQKWPQGADVGWSLWFHNLQHSFRQLVHSCVWCECQWTCSSVGQASQAEHWSMYCHWGTFLCLMSWPVSVAWLFYDYRDIICLHGVAVLCMVWRLTHANFLLCWTSRCMFWISQYSGILLVSGTHSTP